MLTKGMHDFLWSEGAKALPNVAEQLERIADQFKISNYLTVLKEMNRIGDLPEEEYVKHLNEAWDAIEKL